MRWALNSYQAAVVMERQMTMGQKTILLFLLLFGSTKSLMSAVEVGALLLEDETLTNITDAETNMPDILATETSETTGRTFSKQLKTNPSERVSQPMTPRNSCCQVNKKHTMCKYKVISTNGNI